MNLSLLLAVVLCLCMLVILPLVLIGWFVAMCSLAWSREQERAIRWAFVHAIETKIRKESHFEEACMRAIESARYGRGWTPVAFGILLDAAGKRHTARSTFSPFQRILSNVKPLRGLPRADTPR